MGPPIGPCGIGSLPRSVTLSGSRGHAILPRFEDVPILHIASIVQRWAGSFPAIFEVTGVHAVSRSYMSKSDKEFARQFSLVIGFLALFAACLLAAASYIYHRQPDDVAHAAAESTQQRLAPIANVYAGDTGRAAMAAAKAAAAKAAASKVAYGGTTDGKTIFDKLCTTCHTTPATGAPQLGDKAEWAPRIAEGIPTLIKHAIDGYTGPDGNHMPAKGGNPALTDEQVANTVKWIVSQSK